MFERDLFGDYAPPDRHGAVLAETWEYPPFSVWNAREAWWQERKRQWLALGVRSELGRGGGGKSKLRPGGGGGGAWVGGPASASSAKYRTATEIAQGDGEQTGTSIFDPVVCELAYRWFCPPGGIVVDPFAGGSVRGIVASVLGRQYYGCELRAAQVAANRAQLDIARSPPPVWVCGDSREIEKHIARSADFLFSCPPYADLEVYSDDSRDISNMAYPDFLVAYQDIIAASVALLKPDSFACFVVGEARNKRGNYYNFVGDTVAAFMDAGMHYYNEAILITQVGSLPVRVGKQFVAGRKLGKTHQNVLVFVKGSGRRAAQRCQACDKK